MATIILNKPKARNSISADNWLDSLGLYRKNVAHDETCLFRAVSEHLFQCQIYHEKVRKECVEYGKRNFFEFFHVFESIDDWFNHMELLEKHMVVCGNIEMNIVSAKYDYDIVLYDPSKQEVINITNRHADKSISLCLLNGDHYDIILKKDHVKVAGFCQSLVYSVLYENVFGISNVQNIVQDMLYNKKYVASKEVNNNNANAAAPITFKVAKALDPTIYRNIEFDTWSRIRREMRLGDWYYGDENLILGTKCIFNQNDDTFDCYIQRMVENENKCEVYIVKLAQRRVVNYTDLSPENDAKPWPLPYRFCRNVQTTTVSSSPEKESKLPKKRKDRRKHKHSESQDHIQTEAKHDVEAFIGTPLQMQSSFDNRTAEEVDAGAGAQKMTTSQHNLLVTPEVTTPNLKITWDSSWNYSPLKNEWTNNADENHNFPKPMIASAPITPNVIPYHDDQCIYNCPSSNYGAFATWGNYDAYSTQPNQCYEEESVEETPSTPDGNFFSHLPFTDAGEASVCSPLAQSTQPVYPSVVHVPPGTPGVYTPQGIVPTIPLQVYSPPIDVQYVSPRPVMYLPTPPPMWYSAGVDSQPWYPPGVNAQGFIFQTPVNRNT